MEAALNGAREIGFTIVSMTLSLAAVFLPVLFMGGVVGRLLHEFAVVIGAAVLVSGFVSLTLTPMACSRFLRHGRGSHGRLYTASERVFAGMLERVRLDAQGRHAACALHAGGLRAHPRGHRVSVHDHPQGLHPERGHGAGLRLHGGGAGHLVRQHGRAPAGRGRHRQATALHRQLHVVDRRRRAQCRVQYRAHLHAAQAPRDPTVRRRDRPGPPEEALGHPGHERLPPGAAHDQDRGAAHQGPVPVHPPGR